VLTRIRGEDGGGESQRLECSTSSRRRLKCPLQKSREEQAGQKQSRTSRVSSNYSFVWALCTLLCLVGISLAVVAAQKMVAGLTLDVPGTSPSSFELVVLQ
jgi:hypothetical protein